MPPYCHNHAIMLAQLCQCGGTSLLIGRPYKSQREAAIEAVKKIGLNQICEIESRILGKNKQQKVIFEQRKKIMEGCR